MRYLLALALLSGCVTSTLDPAPVASVSKATPGPEVVAIDKDVTLDVGATQALRASVKYPDGKSDQRLAWTSKDPAVAAVDPASGVLTAKGPGATSVTAAAVAAPDRFALITVFVKGTLAEVKALAVSPATTTVKVGATVALAAKATLTDGREVPGSVTWTVEKAAFASVDQAGIVTGLAPGETRVVATADENGSIRGYATITVTP